jgi:antitoxin MazE
MSTSIIAIGTSKGVIIPSHALKELNLSLRSSVDVEVSNGSIVIKPVVAAAVRSGWEQAAMLASQEVDELTDTDGFNEEDDSWWTWE